MLTVTAWITIPVPFGVPLTLQTFGVALCGYCLSRKYAALSVSAYLMLGALGMPVFSGFRGGIGVLFAGTGGFLFGFILMAIFCKIYPSRIKTLLTGVAGLIICHAAGIIQFSIVTHCPLIKSFLLVSLPFFLKDTASVILAMFIAIRVEKYIDGGNT